MKISEKMKRFVELKEKREELEEERIRLGRELRRLGREVIPAVEELAWGGGNEITIICDDCYECREEAYRWIIANIYKEKWKENFGTCREYKEWGRELEEEILECEVE